ncbi:hypothetical protein ABZ721_22935 [Streptomyces sp. NPDC006733]|uniref:hypothetical protein n=1 Tax=Streptomyces sp. NPDC006733 TaxID=3155460 RepID=UPI0033ED49E4
MPTRRHTDQQSCEHRHQPRHGIRLRGALVLLLAVAILGAELAPRVHIDIVCPAPTLPALIAAELIRRFVGAFLTKDP